MYKNHKLKCEKKTKKRIKLLKKKKNKNTSSVKPNQENPRRIIHSSRQSKWLQKQFSGLVPAQGLSALPSS